MPGDVSDHHQCSGGSGLADHSVSRESELTILNISELYKVVHAVLFKPGGQSTWTPCSLHP